MMEWKREDVLQAPISRTVSIASKAHCVGFDFQSL